jgi:tRNA-specific 2-thiouridylase
LERRRPPAAFFIMADSHPTVAVAMSGGVDSSVAAALLCEEGFDVAGMTMRLQPECDAPGNPVEDARRAARRLGIPHHVADLAQPFRQHVLDYFLSEYRRGRTPNPCVRCNQRIKFGALFEQARALGADLLATGHYVRVQERGDRMALCRAVFRGKDQSYVLAGLSQEQLRGALFPLGGQTKDRTRETARSLGLHVAEKSESQDICFVEGGDYRQFLAKHGEPMPPGPIATTSGEILGTHTGLAHYTVGQRKGLGIAAPEPYYVVRLDPERNAVVVGRREETFARRLTARDVVWGAIPPQTEPFECAIQIRYRHRPAPCVVEPHADGFEAVFEEPQRAVTPGQWAVLYRDDCVLAAGAIDAFG